MKLFDRAKEGWENIWLPRIQEGKTKVELERDKRYESRWVWYHTILAVFLGVDTVLLLWIGINLQIIVKTKVVGLHHLPLQTATRLQIKLVD